MNREHNYYMMNQSTSPEKKSSGSVVRLSISPSQGTFLTESVQSMTNKVNEDKVIDYNLMSNPQFWESFGKFEGFNNKKTIYSRLSYAKRYYKLLLSENLSEVIGVS